MNSNPNPPSRRFRVRGIVQGVGFRYATQRVAAEMGLRGWVRNRSDGSVEAVACGDAARLDAFEAWLHRGPAHARVDSVSAQPLAADDSDAPRVDDGFVIRRDCD